MERPLSPFMFPTWYRFQIASAVSILHWLTGIALTVGSILLAWWFVAMAVGGQFLAATHAFIASPIGVLLFFLWSVASGTSLGMRATASRSATPTAAAMPCRSRQWC
jgi:succinate dehydrogenase / fumarate reductase, cytochrome b subunit